MLADPQTSLAAIADEAKSWLFEAAAPIWRSVRRGDVWLFPERLTIEGAYEPCPHRLFVQARHVFSYCEIGRLGWDGPWREMVEHGVDQLLREGFRDDGFCIHKFGPEGGVHDGRADLYDQAFMLLALAYAGRATGRGSLFDVAEALGDRLDAHWRAKTGRFNEGEIVLCPPYRQNPHMHLLECYLALYSATGAPRWRRSAEQLAELCAQFFLDGATGALLEYFDADLRPAVGDEGRIVEPGHCFEWAWLFETLADWGYSEAIRISDGLTVFARGYGICPVRGVAMNEVLTDGSTRNGDARLWPQTERLKAAAARFRRTRERHECDEALAAYAGLRKYFETPARGVWRDKLRANGVWIEEPAPGSSLYHIICAIGELVDIANLSRDAGNAVRQNSDLSEV